VVSVASWSEVPVSVGSSVAVSVGSSVLVSVAVSVGVSLGCVSSGGAVSEDSVAELGGCCLIGELLADRLQRRFGQVLKRYVHRRRSKFHRQLRRGDDADECVG